MTELQNTILEMIARGEPLADTALRLCHEVERLVPGACCSVVTVDGWGRLYSLAAPSLPESYSDAITGLKIGPNVGTCGTAAYLGQEITTPDIANDPRWTAFRDLVLPLGLKACWSHPIFDERRRTMGTFAFYYKEKRGPTALEREIVDQCVHLGAIAIDRHRRVEEYERRANIDALTGLANRAAFNAALRALDDRVQGSWALYLLDLDNLKAVNDTFGHCAGDILLRQVADRLTIAAYPDRAYRIGGDEFAIIVESEPALRDLEKTARKFLDEISAAADCGGNVISPKATVGLAEMSTEQLSAEQIRQHADFALYHAKENGRGSFVRYWPGIGSRMMQRLTAIRDVGIALRENRIEPHYQPVVDIRSGEIVGLEALCRMRVGDKTLPAASFHEATTDPQIAGALTRRMMRAVARDIRRWLDDGIAVPQVSINVASADFHGASIYTLLSETFGRANVPLRHVSLEVTESVYMDQAGTVQKSVEALRAKGLKVALDDFGTGYASLTHLMSVPVDYIKIDKSFVDRIVSHAPSQIIAEGIIDIATKLGIRVVAEGIETAGQARKLAALGCTLGQGYLYSRAVPRDEAAMLMAAQASQFPITLTGS
ncbi:putative bifunctional diguanylate cyclase/phosphodiesterase [Novosphingobium guangzhouense]|uniref:Diguanylate cyclase n=1 Tax=Novosphingobium guangzhouense TaxID=1850347 RepID=A0A2K2G6P1_9SPHN|nr:EAL domain-containing protein [Novosphingobium guangzhouense]PNU06690.1 diguanylate cyclase [Novosphingobium guangzhouense]